MAAGCTCRRRRDPGHQRPARPPTPGIELFGWSLLLVGAGLGVVMVAVTSSVLGVVPAARSGMAASAVNTSRELGAVAGVAVLGSIVNGLLVTNLNRQLAHILGLPAAFRSEVIAAVTTGTVNTSASTLPKTGPIARIVQRGPGRREQLIYPRLSTWC